MCPRNGDGLIVLVSRKEDLQESKTSLLKITSFALQIEAHFSGSKEVRENNVIGETDLPHWYITAGIF